MIQVGQKIPSVKLRKPTPDGVEEVQTDAFFRGRKVVLLTVPGAFTPPCTNTHLPGYLAHAAEFKAKGVDEIACVAVNDHHVVRAWGEKLGAAGKVTLLADGNGELVRALGLDNDMTGAGMGVRYKRSALVVEDGVVRSIEVEDKPPDVTRSGAESCLTRL
jgi:peroxiredoxin